ncbi:GNAT family N-acetyltransferase [Pseudomonas sp. Q11]|uniref:GNAT family N-acetyltransferase n=1 Tax=Pseudomonas sp. Q11 TaxID=2968470 RepID=UPI00210A933A|nr:GNAT family N-acetyltransferase [Pseudomonas sp. Q11]MCQ6259341.1 GNAT family N-acetyltransferase [Pseudomonas sp. Q11]
MSGVVIRPFRPTDGVGASELFRRVYGDRYVSPDVYLPHMIGQHNLLNRWHSMVAVVNDRVVGHAALCQQPAEGEDAELALIAVDPAVQGGQIATRLAQRLLDSCQDLGLARLSIKQVTSHFYSQRLAQRLGFHDTGLLPDHVPSPFATVHAETIVVGSQVISDNHRPLPHLQWPAACQWLMQPLASLFGTSPDVPLPSAQPFQIRQLPGRVDIVAGHIGLRLAGQLLRLPAHWSLSVRLGLRQQFADDYQRLIDAGFTFTGIMPAEGNPGWQALFHRGALDHPLTLHSEPMQRLHEHVQAQAHIWRCAGAGSAA